MLPARSKLVETAQQEQMQQQLGIKQLISYCQWLLLKASLSAYAADPPYQQRDIQLEGNKVSYGYAAV